MDHCHAGDSKDNCHDAFACDVVLIAYLTAIRSCSQVPTTCSRHGITAFGSTRCSLWSCMIVGERDLDPRSTCRILYLLATVRLALFFRFLQIQTPNLLTIPLLLELRMAGADVQLLSVMGQFGLHLRRCDHSSVCWVNIRAKNLVGVLSRALYSARW
jgi:hypothetical protein